MIRTLNNEPITKDHKPYWFKNVAGGDISGQMIYWLTSDIEAVKLAERHNNHILKTEQNAGKQFPLQHVFYINSVKLSDLLESRILKDWLEGIDKNSVDYFTGSKKHLDKKVVKEFSMSGNKPWASWQEFSSHKHVINWVLLENGIAVGFNENVSKGWGYPYKKLTEEQIKKYMEHNLTYEEYYKQN